MPHIRRRSTRADIAKSMREIEALWKPPPDLEKDTADPGSPSRSAAAGESRKQRKHKPTSGAPQRGRP